MIPPDLGDLAGALLMLFVIVGTTVLIILSLLGVFP